VSKWAQGTHNNVTYCICSTVYVAIAVSVKDYIMTIAHVSSVSGITIARVTFKLVRITKRTEKRIGIEIKSSSFSPTIITKLNRPSIIKEGPSKCSDILQ
jgi:hypothetical protein